MLQTNMYVQTDLYNKLLYTKWQIIFLLNCGYKTKHYHMLQMF